MFQELVEQRNDQLLKAAFNFFCIELGLTQKDKDFISVSLTSKRPRSGASGTCRCVYLFNEIQEINIEIVDGGSIFGVIEAIAHELVHAKQYLRGEFHFKRDVYMFLGFIPIPRLKYMFKHQDMSDIPYYDMLAEQEAFARSYVMSLKFIDLLNKQQETCRVQEGVERVEHGCDYDTVGARDQGIVFV